MGDITRGKTFVDGNTYTAAEFHPFVDDATINPGAITTEKLADGGVTAIKIAAGAITSTLIDQATQTDTSQYAVDSGVADAYVITLSPTVSSLVEGMCVAFKAAHDNTGASTLKVNSQTVKNIKKNGNVALTAGDILTGEIYELRYDGTNFQLLGALEFTRLTNLSSVDLTNDKLSIYDDSAGAYKKVSPISIFNASQSVLRGTNGGRLTLSSGTAVTTNDVTAATNIYFTPYTSNQIALYDGANWDVYAFSELTLSLASITSGTNYDIFIYNNAGTLTLEFLAWTDNTTRATALVTQDGVLLKTGALTRRYLGSIRASANAQCEDSLQKRFLFNYQNRAKKSLVKTESTSSWSYNTNAYRQANNSSSNFVSSISGIADSFADIQVLGILHATLNEQDIGVGIGINSTTIDSASINGSAQTIQDNATSRLSFYRELLTIGVTQFNWLERGSGSGSLSWYSTSGGKSRAGICGTFYC